MWSILIDIVGTGLPGLVIAAIALGASEIGFRIGKHLKDSADESTRTEIFTIQSSTLALLALFLGFSFAMGSTAYENRRQVILNEAVVIGAAYKRAALLPEPLGSDVRALVAQYVDTRLDLFYQGPGGKDAVRSQLLEAQRLQNEIWDRAAAAARLDPHSTSAALAIDALGEMGKLHSKRILAMETSVPLAVVIALSVATAVAMGWVGCAIGLGPRRNLAISVVLSILFGFMIAIIIDLDQPRHGIMRASHTALTDLRETMRPAP